MTLVLTIVAIAAAIIVTLVTCIQLLYLESLRIRTRELPSLEFFKDTLEAKIGMETERGTLVFSVVKHLGLAIVGCLTLAVTWTKTQDWQGLIAAGVLVSAYTVLGTHIVPQIVYRKSDGRGLLPLVPLFRVVAILARPITWFLESTLSLFDLRGKPKPAEAQSTDEHIEALISAGEEEGLIEKGDRELIQSVVAFGDKTVRQVMTPRPRIVAIRQDATLEELRHLVIHEQFSRVPAFDKTVDEIEGFVHVRDMFELSDEERARRRVRDIMRPIRTVPESKPVNDLMREMQEESAHMAVVVNEYGSTAGIVTMEDMVEEIVGEIHDEHEPDRDFHQEPDGSYVVSGSFDLGRLADLVEFHRPEGAESTTVGGLVTEWMGHVPAPGEEVEREGLSLKVLAANHLRVDQVRVKRTAQK